MRNNTEQFKTILSVINWYKTLFDRGVVPKDGPAYSRYKQLKHKYKTERKY